MGGCRRIREFLGERPNSFAMLAIEHLFRPRREQSRVFAIQGARFRHRTEGIDVAAGWHIPVVGNWKGPYPVHRGEGNPTLRRDDPSDTVIDWLRLSFTLGELTPAEAAAFGDFSRNVPYGDRTF